MTRAGTARTKQWALAWLALCLAFALHVADEAANDFLSIYNPTAAAIQERWPLIMLPIFTFRSWITLLGVALIVLIFLTPFAFQGKRWMQPISYLFAIVMLANAFTHVVGSIIINRALPGLYSSPALAAAAAYLLVVARRHAIVALRG